MPDTPTGFTDYTNTPSVVPPVWDKTKGPGGYPMGAFSDVAPMESPMERFVKGLGAISGGKFGIIRSRQDVWKEAHDTKSYLDNYLQKQEQGQVARQEMAQGLPQAQTANRVATANLDTAQAKTGLQQWPTAANIQGQRLALTNPVLEDQQKRAQEGLKFEETHPWLSDDEKQKTEQLLGYGHIGGAATDTQSRIDAYTANLPPDQQERVKTAYAEKSLGLPVGALSRGGGHFADFETPLQKIKDAGLDDQYEVGTDAYGFKIQPKPLSSRRDIASLHIRATNLQHTSDQIAMERRELERYQKRKPSPEESAAVKTRLIELDKRQKAVDGDLRKLVDNLPDVQEAGEEGARDGTAAQSLIPETPQQDPVDVDIERTDAQNAIDAGASESDVKARFKERTGEEL